MEKIKIGLIGLGNIGGIHAGYLTELKDKAELTAVCDISKERADSFAKTYNATPYYNFQDMLNNASIDAVIIAGPNYEHSKIAVPAIEKGLSVLCEKPMAVHINDAKKITDAYAKRQKGLFAIMFQERTLPHFTKIKSVLESGKLGKLVRVTWIDTTRFRTQAYYNSSAWRATWKGEGGGILTNQFPHSLDMYQWLFGMPKTVNGFANIGKYHEIEVEDEVTAYFQHENGMIGHFIASTGEAPGTFRIEIMAENGKLIYEDGKITFYQNTKSMLEVIENSKKSFDNVENWVMDIPFNESDSTGHKAVAERFIDSLISGEENLVADIYDGFNCVMLSNAIMQSSFKGETVTLPMDGNYYEEKLNNLINTSTFVKKVNTNVEVDMMSSFAK